MEEFKTKVKRNYKDSLFRLIFGGEDKSWTLSLYNAVNGSDYRNPEDITITTIEDALYLNMKNDVSFLIADTMNLYEAQSTFNPNMPLRMLIYSGMVYSSYAVFGEKYNDPIYRGSYAPRLGAIMGKLVRNHYAESKQVETDGEPFEIERDKEEFVVLYKDEEFFTYKSEGWQVSYARFADNKNAKGYARKHIKEKKMMKPTIKMYRLLVKE